MMVIDEQAIPLDDSCRTDCCSHRSESRDRGEGSRSKTSEAASQVNW